MTNNKTRPPGWWQASNGEWYPPELHPDQLKAVQKVSDAKALQHRSDDHQRAASTRITTPSTLTKTLWLVFASAPLGLAYLIGAVIVRPFDRGKMTSKWLLKFAAFMVWPFAKAIVNRSSQSQSLIPRGRVQWLIIGGIWLSALHILVGLVLCLTIIGIPAGKISFSMAKIPLAPFNKRTASNSAKSSLRRRE